MRGLEVTWALQKKVEKIKFPTRNNTLVEVTVAYLIARKGRSHGHYLGRLPCRSRLYKILVHLYFNSRFSQDEAFTSISDEEFHFIKVALANREKYRFWKELLSILAAKGIEEARKIFEDKMKIFALAQEIGLR